jgi:hypothetical protein
MAKIAAPAVTADFTQVIEHLKSGGVIPAQPSSALILTARRIHDCTYALILWKFRLKGLAEHGQVFIDEIASDALQILPQVLMGYGKTAKLLTRGVAENVLRHLYFSDHPIEYQRMNRDKKWYLSIDALCDYAKTHPAFGDVEFKFGSVNKISSLYSELSAGVHGRSVKDLEMKVSLSKIAYEQAAAEKLALAVEQCAEAANFMLAIFHKKRMLKFQTEDRRIILRTMAARAREVWNDFE